jgi:hypothetical protein
LGTQFLAPDILEAILGGRQPPDLTFDKLTRNLPLRWSDQRKQLGFCAPGAGRWIKFNCLRVSLREQEKDFPALPCSDLLSKVADVPVSVVFPTTYQESTAKWCPEKRQVPVNFPVSREFTGEEFARDRNHRHKTWASRRGR